MITAWLMDFLTALGGWALGLFPSGQLPPWVESTQGYLTQVLLYGQGLGAWIPWSTASLVFGFILTCMVVSFGIKVTRIVLSFFTLGGGSAA